MNNRSWSVFHLVSDKRRKVAAWAAAIVSLVAGTLSAQVGPGGTVGDGPGAPDFPGPLCPGEIGSVLSEPGIDPGRLGLTMALLDPTDFRLEGISLRSEGPCVEGFVAEEAELVLNTDWRERSSGTTVAVRQRNADPHAGVLTAFSASFWWDGASFEVFVPWDGPVPLPEGPDAHAIPADPAEGRALLERVIADLAPELGPDCFYLEVTGSWEDLTDLGIGDPRGKIPGGFEEADVSLTFLAQPERTCGPDVASPGRRVSFSASYADASLGYLSLQAFSVPDGGTFTGEINEYGASWTNGAYQYGVYGALGDGSPLGIESVRAIAQALDPGFSDACLPRPVTLREAELVRYGFHAARPPADFELLVRSLTARTVSPECSAGHSVFESFDLYWSFGGPEERRIDAYASGVRERVTGKGSQGPDEPPPGETIVISWQDPEGTYYFVSGYNATGSGPTPTRAQLAKVAKSMDPTFVDDGSQP